MTRSDIIRRMPTRRHVLMGVIASLIALLGFMGTNLYRDLRALSTADTDNIQWTVLQLETEFSNLASVLTEAVYMPLPDNDEVRLRTEIALSRINLIGSGRGRELFAGNTESDEIFSALKEFALRAAEIIDRSPVLDQGDFVALLEMTERLRPDVRRLALRGLRLSATVAETRRAGFADQLLRTGLATMLLIAALTGALMLLCRLLTSARQKDADLHATARRLTSTVAASLDGIIIANEKGQIVDYNNAAEAIFGWSRDEILGQTMDQTIIPPVHREGHIRGMKRYLETRQAHVIGSGRVELTALRKTGEEFPVELNITSANQPDGELFIAYLRDISEQKINERKLVDARDQAERTDRAKSRFLTVMSHEMRTPLNGILGVLDLLRTTDLTPQQDRYVGVASASGEVLLEHINEALDITRIETGAMTLAPQTFTMSELITRVTDVLRPLADERRLSLTAEVHPNMCREFNADSGRIGQILTNLIGNAIKFTESGSVRITVEGIHSVGATVASIAVHDTGPGINTEHIENIFGDFVMLARSDGRQSRGDGLGLSISRKVARLMGGDLKAESRLGFGSTFTLTVPLERTEVGDSVNDVSAQPAMPASSMHRKSVLIVEDNTINRSVIKDMLLGFGHEVAEAKDGLEGVKAAEASKFDFIIMDISMPVMDGIEAVRRIRSGSGPNRNTHVLGLTAHGREEYRNKALAVGMNGFCTKPIRLAVLRDQLNGLAAAGDNGEMVPGTIAEDVVSELTDALGADKMRKTTERFFAEFSEAIATLKQIDPDGPPAAISEISHKLRGGAVMLGLRDLADHIDAVSTSKQSDDPAVFTAALDALLAAGLRARTDLNRHLDCRPQA